MTRSVCLHLVLQVCCCWLPPTDLVRWIRPFSALDAWMCSSTFHHLMQRAAEPSWHFIQQACPWLPMWTSAAWQTAASTSQGQNWQDYAEKQPCLLYERIWLVPRQFQGAILLQQDRQYTLPFLRQI